MAGVLILVGLNECAMPDREVETAIRSVVESFLKADLDGAFLSSDNFERSGIDRILVPGDGMRPGWDTVTLVKSYEITNVISSRGKASATVEYRVLGEVPGAEEVIRRDSTEEYHFLLAKRGKGWKLVSPNDLRPHVSIDTTLRHLNLLLSQSGNSSDTLPAVIRQLELMKASI